MSVMQSGPEGQSPARPGTATEQGMDAGNYKDKPAAFASADASEGAKARRQSEGAPAPVIPEFCSPGVFSRTLILIHLAVLATLGATVSLWDDGNRTLDTLFYLLTVFEPTLFIALLALCLARRTINGMGQRLQWILGITIPGLVAGVVSMVIGNVLRIAAGAYSGEFVPLWHDALGSVICAILVAGGIYRYFRLRGRAYAPSFSEARLQALQARIRPHFLFNSLNTVLGLIRSNPKLAESTLENLADLFRVFMRDAREMVPLDDEVLTCREYLAIEKLRLAPRLDVSWQLDGMPGDALVPSLLLQPLLENAVHHGIEPRTDTGVLNICITLVGERVRVEIDNPISTTVPSRPGNQMALSNVRERLMLLYDMTAELRTGPQGERYHVLLEFPYRKERRRRDVRRHFNPDR